MARAGSGEFNRQITIVRVGAGNQSGIAVKSPTVIATVSANYAPVVGSEKYDAAEIVPLQDANFMIRWSPDVKDVRPKDQILFQENATDAPRTWDISSVQPIGMRAQISIRARLLDANT